MLKCVPCLRNNLPMDSVCYYWCWWPELRFSDIAVISAIIKFNSCHTTSLQKFIVKQKHIHILWIPLLGDSFVEKKVQKNLYRNACMRILTGLLSKQMLEKKITKLFVGHFVWNFTAFT